MFILLFCHYFYSSLNFSRCHKIKNVTPSFFSFTNASQTKEKYWLSYNITSIYLCQFFPLVTYLLTLPEIISSMVSINCNQPIMLLMHLFTIVSQFNQKSPSTSFWRYLSLLNCSIANSSNLDCRSSRSDAIKETSSENLRWLLLLLNIYFKPFVP